MADHQLLSPAPEVLAFLAGATQFRRVIRSLPSDWIETNRPKSWGPQEQDVLWTFHTMSDPTGTVGTTFPCPFGIPGDRLFVRECFGTHPGYAKVHKAFYRATDKDDGDGSDGCSWGGRWRPSTQMPRWACRIWLEVVDVRAERVNCISEEDAKAEGVTDSWPEVECNSDRPYAEGFSFLWDSVNFKRGVCKTCHGDRVIPAWAGTVAGGDIEQTDRDCPDCDGPTGYGWEMNPWIFAVTFKRIEVAQ